MKNILISSKSRKFKLTSLHFKIFYAKHTTFQCLSQKFSISKLYTHKIRKIKKTPTLLIGAFLQNLKLKYERTKINNNFLKRIKSIKFVFEMKLQIKNITEDSRLKDVITACYESDEDLYTKYHVIAPNTVENCIEHTAEYLLHIQKSEDSELKIYEITQDNDLVGYFCHELYKKKLEAICGFSILPKYRNKDVKQRFWQLLKSKFKGDIHCNVYNKNTRAIKFLKKSGFKVVSVKDNFSHLLF